MSNVSFKMSLKGVTQTPRKVAAVAALIRERSLNDAMVILEHTPRRPAPVLRKLLQNSLTVARDEHKLQPDSLRLTEIFVTCGPRLKRRRMIPKIWRRQRRQPQPRIIRRSHVFVVVEGQPKPVVKPAAVKARGGKDGPKS